MLRLLHLSCFSFSSKTASQASSRAQQPQFDKEDYSWQLEPCALNSELQNKHNHLVPPITRCLPCLADEFLMSWIMSCMTHLFKHLPRPCEPSSYLAFLKLLTRSYPASSQHRPYNSCQGQINSSYSMDAKRGTFCETHYNAGADLHDPYKKKHQLIIPSWNDFQIDTFPLDTPQTTKKKLLLTLVASCKAMMSGHASESS